MKLFDSASGNWGGKIEFRQEGGGWTGRIWYSRATSSREPITNISYSAGTGVLTFHRPHGLQDYRVTVQANAMEGTMVERGSGASYRWAAQKKQASEAPCDQRVNAGAATFACGRWQ